jgi:NAD(P)-dependent dehydrogenase (short-subunit alcohol dehydrogenase family)
VTGTPDGEVASQVAGTADGLLDGRVAVVTGAAQGLGLAFASALTDAGASVVAIDEQVSVGSVGAALSLMGDVGQVDDVRRMVDAAVAALGGVDILVNNAGRWAPTPVDAPPEQALASYQEIVGANTRGAFLMQRAVVGSMIGRGGGDIVNISTYYVLPPRPVDFTGTNPPTTDLYAASKWALNGFTQAWAAALRQHGIRVNALAMGAVDTPMLRSLFESRGEEPADEVVATWMRPEQQAQLLLELLAEGPEGRSGETIGSWVGEPVVLPPRRQRGEPIV